MSVSDVFTLPSMILFDHILVFPKTDLQGQVDTHQSQLHDMRQEKFVTQGAFTAALLCKADQGVIKSQRWKQDLVCKLLISAGILEDDADGGGLRVREQAISKPSAARQAASGDDNTAYIEECLAHTEKEIARVEKVAMSAITEAQHAVATAAEAHAKSEKARTQCMHVNERCRQVERKCRQADEKCQQVEKKCCDRLDKSFEEHDERIETNSTRIFHLAAEVEGLAKLTQERKVVTTPLAISREETGEVFSVELANLPPKQQQQVIEKPRSEDASVTSNKTKDDAEETHEELRISGRKGDQDHHASCRPGVLDESSPDGRTDTEADNIRTAFLAESLRQVAPPPRRRHSTYTGRHAAVLPERMDSVASRLVVRPVRPQEDRPTANQATPSSWARASSWPLLMRKAPAAVEVTAAGQLRDLKHDREPKTSTDADVGPEENSLIRRGHSTPILKLTLAYGELPRLETTKLNAEGGTLLGGAVSESDAPPITSGSGGAGNDNQEPPLSPSERLERMTGKEAAEALLGASTTVVTRRGSCELVGADVDRISARAKSPGTGLACLGDTPELWCPRDTWDDDRGAPGSSSSDGSSTAIAVAGGREENPPKAEARITNSDE